MANLKSLLTSKKFAVLSGMTGLCLVLAACALVPWPKAADAISVLGAAYLAAQGAADFGKERSA